MKPSPPIAVSPFHMPSWRTLAKWLDVAPFTDDEWARVWELPYAERRAVIARRVWPAAEGEGRVAA